MLSLNQAKVREMEVQLMSAILFGQEDSLQLLLDRVLAELSLSSPEEMRIAGIFSLHCFAWNDTEAI